MEYKSEIYDTIYKDNEKYTCHYSKSIYYPVWQEAIKYIDGRVLELGCGTGQFAQMIKESNKVKYIGIDYSREAIRQAKLINPELYFICNDIFNYKIPKVNTIIALELFEHLENDLRLIRRIPKYTKIVFSVPDFPSDNHYRVFKDEKEIRDRFSMINISLIKTFQFVKNPENELSTIFLCIGNKK